MGKGEKDTEVEKNSMIDMDIHLEGRVRGYSTG